MRDVTEEIPGAVSDDADTGNSTDNGKEKERTKAHNMETVSTVSAKLLQSFEVGRAGVLTTGGVFHITK